MKLLLPLGRFVLLCATGIACSSHAMDLGTVEMVCQRALKAESVEQTLNSGKFLEAEAVAELELLAKSSDLRGLLAAGTNAFRFLADIKVPGWADIKGLKNLTDANLLKAGETLIVTDGRKAELVNWLMAQGADLPFKQAKPSSPGSPHPLDDVVLAAARCGPRTLAAVLKAVPREQLQYLDAGNPMAATAAISWLFPDGIGCYQGFAEEGAIGAVERDEAFLSMVANQVGEIHGKLAFGNVGRLGTPASNAAKSLGLLIQLTAGVPHSALKQSILDGNPTVAQLLAKATSPDDAAGALQTAIAAKLESPGFPADSFAKLRTQLEELRESARLAQDGLPKGRAYFSASDLAHGFEIWTTDGTAAGTALLADLAPGPQSGEPVIVGVAARGVVAMVDVAGTRTVVAIDPLSKKVEALGADCRDPEISVPLPGGALLFADKNGHGWVTEGTRDRTWPLAFESSVHWAKFENGRCLIGCSLQKSKHGEGFFGIAELAPPYRSAVPLVKAHGIRSLDSVGVSIGRDSVFLNGSWPSGSREAADGFASLLAVDGPLLPSGKRGAVQLQTLHPQRLRCYPLQWSSAWVGDRFYFGGELLNSVYEWGSEPDHSTGFELMTTDGTAAGTRLVADLSKGNSWPTHLANVNGTLVFAAAGDQPGKRLWKLGDSGKPEPLSGEIPITNYSVDPVLHAGNTYFAFGNQLWRSDGTVDGTRLVYRFEGTIAEANAANGCLLVQTLPERHRAGNPIPLWRVKDDGSGVIKLAEMPMGPTFRGPASAAETVVEPIVKNEPAPKATMPSEEPKRGLPASFRHFRVVYVGSEEKSGLEPHVFDSKTGESGLLIDINEGPQDSSPGCGAIAGGLACFWAKDEVHGWRVWKTDGTPEGTKPLAFRYGQKGEPFHARGLSEPTGLLVPWQESLVLSYPSGVFQIDPVKEALFKVALPKDAFRHFLLTPDRMLGIFGGMGYKKPLALAQLQAAAPPRTLGQVPDGEIATILLSFNNFVNTRVLDIGSALILPRGDSLLSLDSGFTKLNRDRMSIDDNLGAVTGGKYVFAARETGQRADGSGSYDKYGMELYVTDGTPEGTRMLKDLIQLPGDQKGSDPLDFTRCGEKVVFTAKDPAHFHDGQRRQLWITDATAEGTIPVTDLDRPSGFISLAGGTAFKLYPSSYHWTDGTPGNVKTIFANADVLAVFPFGDGAVFRATSGDFSGFWWWSPDMEQPLYCGTGQLSRYGGEIQTSGVRMMVIPFVGND